MTTLLLGTALMVPTTPARAEPPTNSAPAADALPPSLPVLPAPGAPEAKPDTAPATSAPGDAAPGTPPVDGAPTAPASPAPAADAPPPEPAASDAPAPTTRKIPKNRGRIEGTVVDGRTGEPLIEAQVSIVGQKKKVLTDIDGNFSLTLAPGTYAIRVWAELKTAKRIDKVDVELGKVTRLDVTLGGKEDDKKIAVQEVVVVAQPDKATEAVQLVRRQKSASVSDGVSAEQIARTPDTNASEAVKRVVGATIQDGKYVVIRGLGGRYSLALLNGVILPSPDPDLPTAPLDLFPAALLANLTVAKTFTPDMPGAFAGGALMIESRDFPTKLTLKLSFRLQGDTEATFRQLNTYKGGNLLDFVGYDNGARKLPDTVSQDKPATDEYFSQAELNRMGAGFNNRWTLLKHNTKPGMAVGATLGDSFGVGNGKIGYLGTVSFSNRWSRRQEHIQKAISSGSGMPATSGLDLRGDTGTEHSTLGTLLNVGYMPASAHRIGFISLYTHNTEDSASFVGGSENNGNVTNRLRLKFLERQMTFSQVNGEDSFKGGRLLLAWQGNFAITKQNEPDTRDLFRRLNEGTGAFVVDNIPGTAERTFGTLTDRSGGAGLDVTVPFAPVKVKAGGNFLISSRNSRVRRFHFDVDPSIASQPTREIFNQIGSKVDFEEATLPDDAFAADRGIFAGYLMGDVVKTDPFRFIGGVRYEVATLDLTSGNSLGEKPPFTHVSHTDNSILPSINAVYSLGSRANLRAGYSITVARPHMRELAPTLFFDYIRRRTVRGNPKLEQTSIQNVDFRWETFLQSSEVLAASAFYKRFDAPIERVIRSAGDGDQVLFENADKANLYGIEVEARLSAKRISNALRDLNMGANLALIQSTVKDRKTDATIGNPRERALQGQSPYVVNVDMSYRPGGKGTLVSLLYNVYGRRIYEVGSNLDHVYEEAFHRVDATVVQPLGGGFSVKASGINLLNQRMVQKQEGIEILAYPVGVAFFASLEWSMENRKENKQ